MNFQNMTSWDLWSVGKVTKDALKVRASLLSDVIVLVFNIFSLDIDIGSLNKLIWKDVSIIRFQTLHCGLQLKFLDKIIKNHSDMMYEVIQGFFITKGSLKGGIFF